MQEGDDQTLPKCSSHMFHSVVLHHVRALCQPSSDRFPLPHPKTSTPARVPLLGSCRQQPLLCRTNLARQRTSSAQPCRPVRCCTVREPCASHRVTGFRCPIQEPQLPRVCHCLVAAVNKLSPVPNEPCSAADKQCPAMPSRSVLHRARAVCQPSSDRFPLPHPKTSTPARVPLLGSCRQQPFLCRTNPARQRTSSAQPCHPVRCCAVCEPATLPRPATRLFTSSHRAKHHTACPTGSAFPLRSYTVNPCTRPRASSGTPS